MTNHTKSRHIRASMNTSILGEILAGGADKVREAGAVLAGGHSIQDDVPKYGLSVTGFAHPKNFISSPFFHLHTYLRAITAEQFSLLLPSFLRYCTYSSRSQPQVSRLTHNKVTQLDTLPKTMLFYNGGATLTVEGSDSLEDLKHLEAQGVEILTCGTCLSEEITMIVFSLRSGIQTTPSSSALKTSPI